MKKYLLVIFSLALASSIFLIFNTEKEACVVVRTANPTDWQNYDLKNWELFFSKSDTFVIVMTNRGPLPVLASKNHLPAIGDLAIISKRILEDRFVLN